MSRSDAHTLAVRETQVGNPDAAQDLYGLGVRIGFYLQALGMLLYLLSDRKDYGQGLKVASGSLTVSILASWFGFAAGGSFSPSEAIIVLLILICLSYPAKTTLLNPRTIVGETIGLIAMLVVELGTCSALLWTFARLVNTLPTLGTENVVFFFAKVDLNGWFRYLALVFCVVDAATSLLFAYKVLRITKIAWDFYKDTDSDKTEPDEDTLTKIVKIIDWKPIETAIKVLQWLFWALAVVAVELTIQWNHLSPSNDLQTPGQLMPLITGIIIVIDSGLVAGRTTLRRRRTLLAPLARFITSREGINLIFARTRDNAEESHIPPGHELTDRDSTSPGTDVERQIQQ